MDEYHHTHSHRQTIIPPLSIPDPMTQDYHAVPGLSDTERQLLIEYKKLAKNLSELSQSISKLTSTPTSQALDTLQALESKTSLVFTLLKASVYSVFVQNEQAVEQDGSQEEEYQYKNDRDVSMGDDVAYNESHYY